MSIPKPTFGGHEATAPEVRESDRATAHEIWVKYWTLLATLDAIMALPPGYESPANRPDKFLRRQVSALNPQHLHPKAEEPNHKGIVT